MLKRYPLITYVVLTYAFTWLAWMPLAYQGSIYDGRLAYFHFLGSFGPMASAITVTGLMSGWSGIRDLIGRIFRWKVPLSWHLLAWFGPAALYLIAAVVVRVVWGQWPAFKQFGTSDEYAQLAVPVYWLFSILCYGFGEEVGWRGFALPWLQQKYSKLISTLLISFIWAAWHVPLFSYSAGFSHMGIAEIFGWYISLLTGSVLLTWMYNGARNSVLIVAIFHASLDVAITSPAPDSLSTVMGALLTILGVFSIRFLIR